MQLISPIVDIAIISFAMALISQILQRKLVNMKKMKASQAQMKEMQKKLNELLKKEDEQSKKEAARLQNEMLKAMNETMKGSMKHMLISLPIFWGIFAVAGAVYLGATINTPIALPVLHRDFSFEITPKVSWLWWYIYCSVGFSIVFSIILKIVDKIRNPPEKK